MRRTYSGGDGRRADLRRRSGKGRMVDLDEITYAVKDGFAEIVLDRPDSLNPISARPGGTRDQILHALDEAAADPGVGAVVLRGSGRAFSAGGDLAGNRQRESAAAHRHFVERWERFHAGMRASPLPLIAAVHGYCLGAAVALAASCDFVVAADSARFGVPEGRMGLVGATPLVPVIGRQWAKFLIMTGELIDARQACSIGLVLAVVPEHALIERCHDLARRLTRMPPEAMTLNKRAVDATADAVELPGSLAGRAHDVVTLANSVRATAPDGRNFRRILETEGVAGVKRARDQQWRAPWLDGVIFPPHVIEALPGDKTAPGDQDKRASTPPRSTML
jgi:enoyl-CoA hydratase/carnithine racemase